MADRRGATERRQADSPLASRRRALTYMVVTTVGGMATVAACSTSGGEPEADSHFRGNDGGVEVAPLSPEDLTPRLTPNDKFYVQSYRETPTEEARDPETWTLTIDGLVSGRLELTLADILALPAVERQFTLECIGNPVGGQLIGNAVWVGTPLRPLLERAEIKSWAKRVAFHGLDDYVTSIPIEQALAPGVLLAYRMNGEPLPARSWRAAPTAEPRLLRSEVPEMAPADRGHRARRPPRHVGTGRAGRMRPPSPSTPALTNRSPVRSCRQRRSTSPAWPSAVSPV